MKNFLPQKAKLCIAKEVENILFLASILDHETYEIKSVDIQMNYDEWEFHFLRSLNYLKTHKTYSILHLETYPQSEAVLELISLLSS